MKRFMIITVLLSMVLSGGNACDTCTTLKLTEVKRDSAYKQLSVLQAVGESKSKRFKRTLKDYKYFATRARYLKRKVNHEN